MKSFSISNLFFSRLSDFLIHMKWNKKNLQACFLNDKLNSSKFLAFILSKKFYKIDKKIGDFTEKNFNAYFFCRRKSCKLSFKIAKQLLDCKQFKIVLKNFSAAPLRIEISKLLAPLFENVLNKVILVNKLNLPCTKLFLRQKEIALLSLIKKEIKTVKIPKIKLSKKSCKKYFKLFLIIKWLVKSSRQILLSLGFPQSQNVFDFENIEVADPFFTKSKLDKLNKIVYKPKVKNLFFGDKKRLKSNLEILLNKKTVFYLIKDFKQFLFLLRRCPYKNYDFKSDIYFKLLMQLPLKNFWIFFLSAKKIKHLISFEPNSIISKIISFCQEYCQVKSFEYQYSIKAFSSPSMTSCAKNKILVDPIFKKIYNPFSLKNCKISFKNNLFQLRKKRKFKIRLNRKIKWIVFFDENIENSIFGLNDLHSHLNEIKKIIRFLVGKPKYGLLLKPQFVKNSITKYLLKDKFYKILKNEKRIKEVVKGKNRNIITPSSLTSIGSVFVGKLYGGSAVYEAAKNRKGIALLNDQKTITPWQSQLIKSNCIYKNIDYFLENLAKDNISILSKPIFQFL